MSFRTSQRTDTEFLSRYLEGLQLKRVSHDGPTGLVTASVPVPRGGPQALSLGGRATHVIPLGHWHDVDSDVPAPRRLLLTADAGGGLAPESINVSRDSAASARGDGNAAALPIATEHVFAHADAKHLNLAYFERPMLRLEWNGRWVGLVMGMRVRGEVHWWEHALLAEVSRSQTCVEIEMGGTIPYDLTTFELMESFKGKDNPYHHKHNWLNGHITARLHSNGVCEIVARHVNSMFFDDGLDLHNAVPVLGISVAEGEAAFDKKLLGVWYGDHEDRGDFKIGANVRFDFTEVAHLASPRHPGNMSVADGFLVFQPYMGVELYSGAYAKLRTGDPFVVHAERQTIPRGMARSLRFSLSLNPERPPRVARFIAPAWWYGACEEFLPDSVLPVRADQYDAAVESGRQWFHKYMIRGGFCDGEFPNQHTGHPDERKTPATEGDVPGGMFLTAYRTGDPQDYDCGMRASYFFTEVLIDHATKRVRMQDYVPPTVALPLQRVHGTIMAWLETGDAFCLRTAQAVVDTAYHWHKNSWPRRAVGRDARFVHSMMVLYRYLGDRHVLAQARDTIRDVGLAQWPDGSFGDQGGGSGIHGHAAYITKPWMGALATFGVMDYLELFPDDAEGEGIVRRYVDWLMRERGPRVGSTGKEVMAWTYMHDFKGKDLPGRETPTAPTVNEHQHYQDYHARFMTWLSQKTGDPKFYDAFAEAFEGHGTIRTAGYWELPGALNFLPWLQAKLWDARLTPDGKVEVRPSWLGPRTPQSATVMTPKGDVTFKWLEDGRVAKPADEKRAAEAGLTIAASKPTASRV